jgi:hypothetical protein
MHPMVIFFPFLPFFSEYFSYSNRNIGCVWDRKPYFTLKVLYFSWNQFDRISCHKYTLICFVGFHFFPSILRLQHKASSIPKCFSTVSPLNQENSVFLGNCIDEHMAFCTFFFFTSTQLAELHRTLSQASSFFLTFPSHLIVHHFFHHFLLRFVTFSIEFTFTNLKSIYFRSRSLI